MTTTSQQAAHKGRPDSSWFKGRFRMPHVYVIMAALILIAYLITWLAPQGSFERVEGPRGAQLVAPGTFQYLEADRLGFLDLLFSIPRGLVEAGPIIFGGLMIGGLFAMLQHTGLLALMIQKVVNAFSRRPILIIPVMMIPMTLFTTFTGAMELGLVYVPVMIPLMLRMGYDRFTATAMVLVSTCAGFSVALTAPATVGLAQTLMELPLYSGIGYRSLILAFISLTGMLYVMRYAMKVQYNPQSSLVHDDGQNGAFLTNEDNVPNFSTWRNVIGGLFLAAGMGVMIHGLLNHGWYFIEIGGWYAFMAIVLGLIYGFTFSRIAEIFHEGFNLVLVGVIVIGLARAASILLNDGNVLDTIVHGISQLIDGTPSYLTAVGMFIVQGLFNFLVGSGSGQALITIPIMSGLSDLLDVTRQTAVLAFQFGDGFTNIIFPGVALAILAIGKIPYGRWLKFIAPLMLVWCTSAAFFLIIAQHTGW